MRALTFRTISSQVIPGAVFPQMQRLANPITLGIAYWLHGLTLTTSAEVQRTGGPAYALGFVVVVGKANLSLAYSSTVGAIAQQVALGDPGLTFTRDSTFVDFEGNAIFLPAKKPITLYGFGPLPANLDNRSISSAIVNLYLEPAT